MKDSAAEQTSREPETKTIPIYGFTQNGRKKHLIVVTGKMAKGLWELDTFNEGGLTGSNAVFRRSMENRSKIRKKWTIMSVTVLIILVSGLGFKSIFNARTEREKTEAIALYNKRFGEVSSLIQAGKFDTARIALDQLTSEEARLGVYDASKMLATFDDSRSEAGAAAYFQTLSDKDFRLYMNRNVLPDSADPLWPVKREYLLTIKNKAEAIRKAAKARLLEEIAANQLAAEIGNTPVNSGWNGSVQEVKEFLDRNLHDPDSVKYEEWGAVYRLTFNGQAYWAVDVIYRAKNGFGGYVRSRKTALIRHNQVLRMIDLE